MRTRVIAAFAIIISFIISAWQPQTVEKSPDLIGGGNAGYIIHYLSGLCVGPRGTLGYMNGTVVQLETCENTDDQYWELTDDYFLFHPVSGKCLDVIGAPGYKNQTKLQLWDCESASSTTDQTWTLTSDGYFQNIYSGRCIDVPGSTSTQNGLGLQLWDCEFSSLVNTDQRWYIAEPASSSYSGENSGYAGNDYSYYEDSPSTTTEIDYSEDLDGDYVTQDEETWVANAFVPIYFFDTEEPAQSIRWVYQVTPIASLWDGINEPGVVLTILTLYESDWAYPSPLKFLGYGLPEFQYLWHDGDNEAIELWLTRSYGPCGNKLYSEMYPDPDGSAMCYTLKRMILHSHGHTRIYSIPAEYGHMPICFDSGCEDQSVVGQHHPHVYISRGKHGAYIDDYWECNLTTYQGNISYNDWIGLVEMQEFCSSAYDSAQAGWKITPYLDPSVNVGEVNDQLFTYMDNHPILAAFSGESVWDPNPFCGGYHDSLLVSTETCAGSNLKKWCGGWGDNYCGYNTDFTRP